MNDAGPTVFVVEDTSEVRKSLSRVLGAAGYQVRSFESAEAFLAEHHSNAHGCLLLDILMPGLSGLDLQRALVASPNALPIIFLTGTGDIQTSVRAMKDGAVDFLTKPIDHVRLFAAVDQAFRRNAEERSEVEIRCLIRHRLNSLTPREREVMMQVLRGRLNKQIAAELGTGEKTVKVHRARVMVKMVARSVAELVQLGARVGVEMEPALAVGATTLSWRPPQFPISKGFD
jgi:FixJ family two-component response regulator